jgi:transcriptional regulator with XRE-family HTH domain
MITMGMQLQSISRQLRDRRLALGLSLSDVARRAGTSAATLSRYEHGWNRFELYTLRKLAAALGCRLSIELRPRAARGEKRPTRRAAASRLKRLFWDHDLAAADLAKRPVWVAERVLEYGNIEDVRMLDRVLGRRTFLTVAAAAVRVSPRTRNFWQRILELEGRPCTTAHSRNTAWNS